MPAVQNKAFPLAGLMCTLRGIAHAHEGKAGITVPANASSSFSRRGDEESFETSTRMRVSIFCRTMRREANSPDSYHSGYGYHMGDTEFSESIKKGLLTIANPVYGYSAPAKSGAGIGVLILHTATQTRPASFLLSQLSHTQIMVGCVGASHEAPVSVCAGYANPAQLTTSEIGVSGGEFISLHTEAAIMATTPTQYPQFIWLIAAVRRDMPTITAKIHHIAAESEREARRTLARDHVCFFAGRIRLEVAA